MTDELQLLKKRFIELAKKSHGSGIFLFTDFLGLGEQSAFEEILCEIRGIRYSAFGGAVGTERVMVRFGDPEELYYEEPFPIKCLLIEPLSEKYSDSFTHRDFLGAILNLGIERSKLGDIVLRDKKAYVFATEEIAAFIEKELTRVKHTDVKVSFQDSVPEGDLYRTERHRIVLSGERIDAAIAKLYHLSRDEAKALFDRGRVFIGGKESSSPAKQPKDGDMISVRGYGRFIYVGKEGDTKKGKASVLLDVFV